MDAMRSESWPGTVRLEDYRWHSLLLLLMDLAILSAALCVTLALHPHVPMDRLSEYTLWGWSRWFLLLWIIWIPVASAIDIYEPKVAGDANRALVFTALVLWVVGPVHLLVPIISVPLIHPLWTWFVFMGLALLALTAWRGAYALLWAPVPLQHITLVGRPHTIEPLAQALDALPEVQVTGVLAIDGRSDHALSGSLLASQIRRSRLTPNGRLDAIVVEAHLCQEPEMARLLSQWSAAGLTILSIANCYETWLGQIPLEHLDVTVCLSHMQERQRVIRAWDAARRFFDLIAALLGLPFLALALVFVGVTRRGDAEAPVIVPMPCVGRQARPFNLWRFHQAAPAWLRGLPMLWNLLLGQITLIGPRIVPQSAWPMDPSQAALLRLRTTMRPGLVGWAQVRRPQSASSADTPAADLPYDLYQIKNCGPSGDLAVLYHLFVGATTRLRMGARAWRPLS